MKRNWRITGRGCGQCRFSDSGGLQPGFVQVINVRGNHWITLSNLLCTIDQTCVYDSYLDLNVKTALKKISYPVAVDIAACELAKREKCFTMLVEEIQQQEAGNDCGLFAIAYTVLLCFNEDPCKATKLTWSPLTRASGRKFYTNGRAQCTASVASPMMDRSDDGRMQRMQSLVS